LIPQRPRAAKRGARQSTPRRVSGILCTAPARARETANAHHGTLTMKQTLRLIRTFLVAAAVATASGAYATTPVTNYSDLWAAPDEPGWGLNVSQQADTLFVTLFTYDKGERAVWYSATLTYQSTGANGAKSYAGDLYETTGPALGQPYDPRLVVYRQVGRMTVDFGDAAHALLVYSVDGVLVTRQVGRLTFATQTLAGDYIGATSDVTYDCKDPARNGLVTTDPGPFTIRQEGGDLVLRFPTCTFTGKYTQQGQIGEVDSIYECTHLGVGETRFTSLRADRGGITGVYEGRDKSCRFRGNVGGMRVLE
jgi:hypothetical protein